MLASRPRRFRSSTSASTPEVTKAAQVLQVLLDRLSKIVQASASGGYPSIQELLEGARKIHQHVTAPLAPSPPQNDFRRLRGFQILLDVLRCFAGFYDPERRTDAEKAALFHLLHIVLAIFSATFRGHAGNRRYFHDRVAGGGWEALEQALASIGLGGADSDLWANCQLFGKLLSFALDDQRLDELCQSVACSVASGEKERRGTSPDRQALPSPETSRHAVDLAAIESKLGEVIGPKTTIPNPDIIRAVVAFWESMSRGPEAHVNPASIIVLSTLSLVGAACLFNLHALHRTGITSRFLRLLFAPDCVLADAEKARILPLCRSLVYLGIDQLADAQLLLLRQDSATSEFCVDVTNRHRGPPFIQFDLSLHGHSSIELPSLGRIFPPSSSPGYTFTAWIRVDRFDPESHTTIFGVFDASRTCFLLAYLEKDTKNFILQTSLTSSRPSVRFKTVAFAEKRWYHIAVVHRRPKTMTASKASLFVDGEFTEQARASYPSPPPLSNGSTESFASFASTSGKTSPVQAFLGTPQALSSRLGPGNIWSKWSLASAHLFEDILSDDFIAVHYRLGPRYQGNFQDCLGGFQTYEASAALGLRNENLHPGKDENSDIVKAIRDKASSIMPESRILMSTFPRAVLGTDGSFVDSSLFRSLSKSAAGNLFQSTTSYGQPVAINSAVPCINDALVRQYGVSVLTGDPVLATPYYFDDNLWRLGGFTPVALKLVERSSTGEELLRSVELMLRCIDSNWRNSEAVERDNGYAILSMLLRAKLGYTISASSDRLPWRLALSDEARDQLTFRLLSLVLEFVGYKYADPVESFIVNPLAYRILLIDLDSWRKSAPLTQELYYKQFETFAVKSKYHQFNSRRLLRMRIIKRLLDALKAETMSEDILPHFIASFESLVKCNYNAEVHRALALFITYALHNPAGHPPGLISRAPKPTPSASGFTTPLGTHRRPTTETNPANPVNSLKMLTKRQLGVRILDMYTRLLCEKNNLVDIRRFAKTVTNKVNPDEHDPQRIKTRGRKSKAYMLTSGQWLLYLLAKDDPEVVVHGSRILARLLVTQPTNYTAKFASRTGGFHIMAYRLRQWWDIPTLWPICFSVLFGYDPAEIDFGKAFEFFSLLEIFGESKVVFPDVLPVLAAMLQHGLRDILRHQDDPDSPGTERGLLRDGGGKPSETVQKRPRARSMELGQALDSRKIRVPEKERVTSHAIVLQTVVRFLADMHTRSASFRDFALGSDYVRLLLSALYPAIVSTDPVTPETELNSKDSVLSFEGGDVIMRPVPGSSSLATPIVRTSTPASYDGATPASGPSRGTPLRRPSSFILVTSQQSPLMPTPARLNHVMSPKKKVVAQQISNVVLEGVLDLIIMVFIDQILVRKDYSGFGLFLRVPPGFQEHQAYFESYVLRNTITQLGSAVQLDQKVLTEPKVLQNMARFGLHMAEAIFEGWFINGAEAMLDFSGMALEYLQRPEVAGLKSVRLCSSAVSTIRNTFLKMVLLRLSDIDDPQAADSEALATMQKLLYWQAVLLNCLSTDDEYLKLLWYQLYSKLMDCREQVRLMVAMLWRIMLVQKPNDSAVLFRQCATPDQQSLAKGFRKLTEVDDASFLEWVDQHRPPLDALFFGAMSKPWEEFVASENQRTADTARSRIKSRKEKLKQWHVEAQERENLLTRHEMANSAWMKSIYFTEHFKHQRLLQDQQDDNAFLASTFAKMDRDLRRPGAVFSETQKQSVRWKLDQTEGRNRMRLRLLPEYPSQQQQQQPDYQPKQQRAREGSGASGSPFKPNDTATRQSSIDTPPLGRRASSPVLSLGLTVEMGGDGSREGSFINPEPGSIVDQPEQQGVAAEDDFELVDDPNDLEDNFEDKNRKVMRRLQQGDTVQNVFNISRIVGLDAAEGILIIGKQALYIMDNLFQGADGEIVNVWQAPPEERDPFSIIITDAESASTRRSNSGSVDQESRSWKWHDVLSISKRRFLFRDVAIEIFFTDGRSYLLTAMNPAMRDEVWGRLTNKTPHANGPGLLPNPEDAWRLEGLRLSDEVPQTLGAKFGSIFNSSAWNPMMRRWQKGEISNFHYLMLVNTLAGRTFNDLTQYPVFPWVLADYTSEELDLSNPRTFRDLSKPMGAQMASRTAEFSSRYQSLAEIGDQPFHYGTHYSSAMIVSSYLIRLPPFVQTFIMMQGGTFDHPDRMFYSIEGAWASASRENGSDVRELIPEFFYLPDFLTNINGYNFGMRQGDAGSVDSVVLPPWARGDPKIFIAKHREALESPYVSQRLHQWIDLVFGHKQRGEAALEALNVFHPLSYRGAKDLDNITDPQERLIITRTIHNFGQTPHQVFTRPHPARDYDRCPVRRLDNTPLQALTRLPHPLLDSHERVASLIYSPKLDRLLCASPFRLNLPPHYDKFLEWGYADGSVRFFFNDGGRGGRRPAGLFENLHIGQLSAVLFADSKTLVTAGEDCVVSVYTVRLGPSHGGGATGAMASGLSVLSAGLPAAVSGGGGCGVSSSSSIGNNVLGASSGGMPSSSSSSVGGLSMMIGSGSGHMVVDQLTARSSLFGHKQPVTSMAVSKAFSTLLTISRADGVAMLWDLNRLEFIRRLKLPPGWGAAGTFGGQPVIECAKIHDGTGDIMICGGTRALLYTLNGELMVDQDVGLAGGLMGEDAGAKQESLFTGGSDNENEGDGNRPETAMNKMLDPRSAATSRINIDSTNTAPTTRTYQNGSPSTDHLHDNATSATNKRSPSLSPNGRSPVSTGGTADREDDLVQCCAFYEGAGSEWVENTLVFTGHGRGRVHVWRKAVSAVTGRWCLEFVRRLDHVDPRSEDGRNVEAAVTCVAPMPQLVYTGDEDGRVWEWNLIQRER